VLIYATVPDFYAEVERAADPELRLRPVIVGGDPRKRGLVQAATADARAAGVELGMPVVQALEKCPRAKPLRTDMRRYREASARLRTGFRAASERLEPAGLEAAWLDVTGAPQAPDEIARRLRAHIAAELELPLQLGIAPVKFLAKLAAERSGSDEISWIHTSQVQDFLDPLPTTCLPGVGPKTAEALAAQGARTVAQVRALGRARLETALGNHGVAILAFAEGRDSSRLRVAPHPRSLSQEATLPEPELDRVALGERLAELAAGLEAALQREGLEACRVILKLRYADGEAVTRTRSGISPVSDARRLLEAAQELLARTQAGSRPVRRLGLAVASLARPGTSDRQLDLFGRS
jgi:DNA polymerase-4